MINDFRDINRDDSFDPDRHIDLWNKYVEHIFSTENTISRVAELTSIHQFLLSIIEYRFQEFFKSFTTYIDFYLSILNIDDQGIYQFLIDRVSVRKYDNVFAEILIRDDLKIKFDSELKLLNNFVTELLIKREINSFVVIDDLNNFNELKNRLDFTDLIDSLNLYIQDKRHSNLIIEIIELYYKGDLDASKNWENVSTEVKSRIAGESKLGRNPYEEYPQKDITEYVKKCLSNTQYIWDTPKKKGQYKISKIAKELLNELFNDISSPMTYEGMIIRVKKAIQEIEKTK